MEHLETKIEIVAERLMGRGDLQRHAWTTEQQQQAIRPAPAARGVCSLLAERQWGKFPLRRANSDSSQPPGAPALAALVAAVT